MQRRRSFFVIGLVGIAFMLFSTLAEAKMVKEVFLGVFQHAPSMADTDRFYTRYHGPEIMRLSGPWIRRYQLWRPFVPPTEAVERFGAVRGRYGELWFGSEQDFLERPPMRGITNPPFEAGGQTVLIVPAVATEEFLDTDPHPEKTTILRWVTAIRYPDGVSVEDGEKWFLEVHAKEAVKQPGLLKLVSHRALNLDSHPEKGAANLKNDAGEPAQASTRTGWVRVNEYWYKDMDAWRKAVLESPPKYTVPSWGGEYPFVEISSTFIPYMHDIDFVKGGYVVP